MNLPERVVEPGLVVVALERSGTVDLFYKSHTQGALEAPVKTNKIINDPY